MNTVEFQNRGDSAATFCNANVEITSLKLTKQLFVVSYNNYEEK